MEEFGGKTSNFQYTELNTRILICGIYMSFVGSGSVRTLMGCHGMCANKNAKYSRDSCTRYLRTPACRVEKASTDDISVSSSPFPRSSVLLESSRESQL